jgi:hypothetical protein
VSLILSTTAFTSILDSLFEGVPSVTLQTIVRSSVAGRLRLRRDVAPPVAPRTVAISTRISISSMRVLETGLALSAIATAVLIGHGR